MKLRLKKKTKSEGSILETTIHWAIRKTTNCHIANHCHQSEKHFERGCKIWSFFFFDNHCRLKTQQFPAKNTEYSLIPYLLYLLISVDDSKIHYQSPLPVRCWRQKKETHQNFWTINSTTAQDLVSPPSMTRWTAGPIGKSSNFPPLAHLDPVTQTIQSYEALVTHVFMWTVPTFFS